MIVEKSPASERSQGHRPSFAERLDEVGFMIGDLTSRRTSPSDVEEGVDRLGLPLEDPADGSAFADVSAVGSRESATASSSTLTCDWCDKPAVVKFWGNWCSSHALREIGPFPWFEWVKLYG
jgi:hypothetical protein